MDLARLASDDILMPRYFFHISDERGWTKDHEGSQFDSVEAARVEAVKASKTVVGQQLIKGRSLEVALAGKIVVSDEHEQVLFAVKCSEAVHADESRLINRNPQPRT
jgi:Domain of unknown function (DUF6894)